MTDFTDRLPPSDVSAERCVLASMMLDPQTIDLIGDIVTKNSFFTADNEIIFTTLRDMRAKHKAVDAVMLRDELTRKGQYEEIGGDAYIGQILNTVPTAAHAEHYAKIVREKHLLREIIRASGEAIQAAYELRPGPGIATKLAESALQIAVTGSGDSRMRYE